MRSAENGRSGQAGAPAEALTLTSLPGREGWRVCTLSPALFLNRSPGAICARKVAFHLGGEHSV